MSSQIYSSWFVRFSVLRLVHLRKNASDWLAGRLCFSWSGSSSFGAKTICSGSEVPRKAWKIPCHLLPFKLSKAENQQKLFLSKDNNPSLLQTTEKKLYGAIFIYLASVIMVFFSLLFYTWAENMIRCFVKIIYPSGLLCFSVCIIIKYDRFPQHKPQYYLKPRTVLFVIFPIHFKIFIGAGAKNKRSSSEKWVFSLILLPSNNFRCNIIIWCFFLIFILTQADIVT